MTHNTPTVLGLTFVTGLLLTGCGDSTSTTAEPPAADETTTTELSTLVTAPDSERVDLEPPTFSNPTEIDNPLFPISELGQVIQLGEEAGAAVRTEVTLLPETRMIDFNGTPLEVLVSQFIAYEDGRVLEVALDFFAQADDGAVWYFGEEVTNYEDGEVLDHEGTWLAGQDGPPGMIMPADPQVGDVYRPENIPGFVFEEVTVQAVDQTVDGPTGPVEGAVVVQEALMDGLLEDKTFAPGYGEFAFAVEAEDEVVTMGLALPIDARPGAVPAPLTAIATAAAAALDAASSEDLDSLAGHLEEMTTEWDAHSAGDVPPQLAAQMDTALADLATAVDDGDAVAAQQAAIAVTHASLDLQLQFRPVRDVDQDRLALWNRQLDLDSESGGEGDVAGDEVVIATIEARLR